jgi:capsular polysaccharide biosynthesis protein
LLELKRNLYVLQRWWWLLIGACIVGGAVAYGATKILITQQYQGSAIVAVAPPLQGVEVFYFSSLAASADAQLIPTLATARTAVRGLPRDVAKTIDPNTLANSTTSSSSVDGELLFITVHWSEAGLVPQLANAVSRAFIEQEQARLQQRYAIIHQELTAQEQQLAGTIRSVSGAGAAQTWLQSQYADTLSKIYQQDSDARIQENLQKAALSIAQPSTPRGTEKFGPRATTNGLLGAGLALLIALVIAFVSTKSYGEEDTPRALQSVPVRAIE